MRSDYHAPTARRVVARETASLVAHGLLYPFGYLPSRHRTERRRDLRTVVLVHGFMGNRAGFFPLQTYLRARGHRRQFAFNYRSGPSIEALAVRLMREIDAHVKGGRVDLVAHSLGGVVARYYLQVLGGARRVDRLITLGTPHHGTEASVYVPTAFVGQLRPGGPFMEHLASLPPPDVKLTSMVAGSDAIILPGRSAEWGVGETRRFPEVGHTGLLLSPAVMRAVGAALEA